MTVPADTTPKARAVQVAFFRSLDGPARVAMALEMSDQARAVSEAGVRYRHPEWTDEQVHAALLAVLLGDDLASKVLASPIARG